jgi:hypothetical protein
MEDINEEDLIMYEESKEMKETIWKIWDLLNDKEIVTKLLLKSPLINELNNSKAQIQFNIKESKSSEKMNYNNSLEDKSKQTGNYFIL